jgi:magnesium transporter
MVSDTTASPAVAGEMSVGTLQQELIRRAPADGARLLAKVSDETAAEALMELNPALSSKILSKLSKERQAKIVPSIPEVGAQWELNQTYPEDTVGRLMEPPVAVFRGEYIVRDVVEMLREVSKHILITYAYVADADRRLLGALTMRDLLLASADARLDEIMLPHPFTLRPEMSIHDAAKESVIRHYPVYPVCDGDGRIVGLVRGYRLFEAQAFALTAQAGKMVGASKEERLSTVWWRSLLFRHPWLQLNLATAFLAAFVVGLFEDTIARVVALAVFLPVMAGQSGNTGCQALAVTLRGMTLGDLQPGGGIRQAFKEAILGFANGALVSVSAAIGMFIYANMKGEANPLLLSAVVFVALTASCVVSGIAGALIPIALKRLGADPATASSIFLTTATDVASMGIFLLLATLFVP